MARRAAKVDNNQKQIVEYLRACGFSVTLLHAVGNGCPDLLAGKHGVNYLIEVKAVKGKLTPLQIEWHGNWRGDVMIVRSVDDLDDIVQG
jgi:Holliday junction resolvase